MINQIIEWLDIIIKISGSLVILTGFAIGIYKFIKCILFQNENKLNKNIKRIRLQVGGYILLGLDFIISADIITSLIHKDQNQIINLAIIVAIRIAISYFLEKELEYIKK